MRDSRVKLLLWTAAALFGAAAAGVVAWGLDGPEPPSAAAGTGLRGRPATGPAGPVDPPLAAFEDVWDVEFGQPLVPPTAVTPPAAAAGPAVAPPVPVKLLGTVVEPGRSMAILAGPDGRPRWLRVGESARDVEVVRIDTDRVTVRHGGATAELRVEKPARAAPTAPTAAPPAGANPRIGPAVRAGPFGDQGGGVPG